MAKLYSIAQWKELFETCETRKLVSLQWWAKRNKHDGLGFRRVAEHRDRVELYCAWNLIGDIASRSSKEQRGQLIRDGKPLTAEDMATMTGFPEIIFQKALDFFSSPKQGWLIAIDYPDPTPNDPAQTPEAATVAATVAAKAAATVAAMSAASERSEGAPDGEPTREPAGEPTREPTREPNGQPDGPAVDPEEYASVPGESPGTPGEPPGGREGNGIEERETRALAHIPTQNEFIAAFMTSGIPPDYLREKWAWFEGNNAWLDRNGQLKKYRVLVISWWQRDRSTWGGEAPKNAI